MGKSITIYENNKKLGILKRIKGYFIFFSELYEEHKELKKTVGKYSGRGYRSL